MAGFQNIIGNGIFMGFKYAFLKTCLLLLTIMDREVAGFQNIIGNDIFMGFKYAFLKTCLLLAIMDILCQTDSKESLLIICIAFRHLGAHWVALRNSLTKTKARHKIFSSHIL